MERERYGVLWCVYDGLLWSDFFLMVYGSYDQVAIQAAMLHISELVGYYGSRVYGSYDHVPIQPAM